MKYLWDHIPVVRTLMNTPILAAFFDFDGTLVPFAPTPEQISVPSRVVPLLTELSQQNGRIAGIISGRSIADLTRHLPGLPPRVMVAGNHGLEWKIQGVYHTVELPAGYEAALWRLFHELDAFAAGIPGLYAEWKEFTISVHFRQVPEHMRQATRDDIAEIIERNNAAKLFTVLPGATDTDVRPGMQWSKAEAVRHFLNEGFTDPGDIPLLYVGDDETDEDVFRSFPEAVTVHVGTSQDSRANYALPSVTEALALLATLATGQLHR